MGTTATIDIDGLIDAVIGREGSYSNNPADKGGATMWGVTEQVARAYGYQGDMRVLPRATAAAIYRRRYWSDVGFDQVALRYPDIAAELFDIGVNMGTAIGATFLQRVLNVFNLGGAQYADVTADGRLGAVTYLALDAFRQRRSDEGGARVLEAIRSLRGARYIEISEARPANEAFTYGWFGRMVAMLKGVVGR
ncbi:glycosyl hydrolase 108 family protein [Sphingomonas sp. CROZ-RG-20F-R02-07]|uniref:glycoside hydrolase family 108 protein n=1 Tax=Sphingomonas sp. CROZ-RG-20F-R02-07 TaxID=2914832 RepID=UPI001F56A129|nr:glycosyl hydrolase 108 family protein [Sphingomonas sp. CROZ-RG-20F-R02-07]